MSVNPSRWDSSWSYHTSSSSSGWMSRVVRTYTWPAFRKASVFCSSALRAACTSRSQDSTRAELRIASGSTYWQNTPQSHLYLFVFVLLLLLLLLGNFFHGWHLLIMLESHIGHAVIQSSSPHVHTAWPLTHPEHVGLRCLVTAFLGDKGDGLVESVLKHAGTKARSCRNAARNHHTCVQIRWMLQKFTITGPDGPSRESVIHR